jgi:hypothetical protein
VLTSAEIVTAHGLCFASLDYVETKLFKLLNNTNAPHFLYQDVLNWEMEAKQLKKTFILNVPHVGHILSISKG